MRLNSRRITSKSKRPSCIRIYCLSFEHLESRLLLHGGNEASLGEDMAEFRLVDVNPASERFSGEVSPRDYLENVSAWYFTHADCGYCRNQLGFLDQMQGELTEED